MAGIKITFNKNTKLGEQLKVRASKFNERRTLAIQEAARRVADDIEDAGRANIAAGGDFKSARWQEGFRALISYRSRDDLRIRVTHRVSYWKVFEFGARILGRPLLWIPLSFALAATLKVRARDFPGRLFRVNRLGKAPLLLSKDGPQYFGKESVRIPRKWRLRQIVYQKSRLMRRYYNQAMKNGRR